MSLKILVCISHVPDTTSKISFVENNTRFDKSGAQFIIGPYDDYALARAMEIKESQGAEVIVLNVGTAETEPTIRKALAIGADEAIRVDAEPTDSFFVAAQIAEIVKGGGFNLVLMGRESIDYNSGVVHGLVGEMLGWPAFSPVMRLEISGEEVRMAREIEGGKEHLKANLPLVAGCQEPIAEWRIPNMRGIMTARTKPLKVTEPVSVDRHVKTLSYELPPPKGACKLIDPENAAELIQLLKNEAKVL